MRTRWAASALVLGMAGSAAPAQEAETPVGPPALRDFSLPGTVTVPQEPAPEPTAPPAELESPPPAPPPPRQEPARTAPEPRAERTPPPAVEQSAPAPVAIALPEPEPESPPPPIVEPETAPEAQPALPAAAEDSASDLSWLLGLLAVLAGLAGLALLWRKWRSAPARHPARPSPELAAHAAEPSPPSPAAEPAAIPPPVIAPPAGAPAAAAPRARVELVFKPAKAEATQTGASVHFELVVKNLGSQAARNVRIEARMFNAGASQDAEVGAFFASPLQEGLATRPFEIPSRSQARLSRVVSMDNAHVRPVTIQGRRLFIPMVAFNILYEWGEGESGQTSRCFVVGREAETPSEKMGAFRLDLGPRIYRSVGQRQTGLARIA